MNMNNNSEDKKVFWAIINGKPAKVTAEEWLRWRYNQENINI